MPHVTIGYGEHNGYRLTELPTKTLEELAVRYPLRVNEQFSPEYDELLITVAVHGELSRREAGGKQEPRVPTLREVAAEIVTKGYQQASKHHHPDGKGNHDAQVRLTQARDELRNACTNIPDDGNDEGTTIIPAPATPKPRAHAAPSSGISDDDVLTEKANVALSSGLTPAKMLKNTTGIHGTLIRRAVDLGYAGRT